MVFCGGLRLAACSERGSEAEPHDLSICFVDKKEGLLAFSVILIPSIYKKLKY